MDYVNIQAVRDFAMQRLVEAFEAFRNEETDFCNVVARYELAVGAGIDRSMIDATICQALHAPCPEIDRDHMSVYSLPLSVRVQNRLVAEGFDTLGKVKGLTVRRVLSMPMMGRRGLREIQDLLAAHNVDMPPGSWVFP